MQSKLTKTAHKLAMASYVLSTSFIVAHSILLRQLELLRYTRPGSWFEPALDTVLLLRPGAPPESGSPKTKDKAGTW